MSFIVQLKQHLDKTLKLLRFESRELQGLGQHLEAAKS